jgi:SAM-dependent methyltransferase
VLPSRKMEFSFDEKQATPLCEIMGRNGSDKGSIDITTSWHNYTTFYYSIFKDIRQKKLRIFELGLGTNNVNIPSNMGPNGRPGASLYGWAEFFPNSDIFGADIDTQILFKKDRIKTFYCDQTNPYLIQYMWNQPELKENFDIIIEDGLHVFEASVCFFENSIRKLNPGGYFIIEDILVKTETQFMNKIKEWENIYKDCTFKLLNIPSTRNSNCDNMLLVIYRNKT